MVHDAAMLILPRRVVVVFALLRTACSSSELEKRGAHREAEAAFSETLWCGAAVETAATCLDAAGVDRCFTVGLRGCHGEAHVRAGAFAEGRGGAAIRCGTGEGGAAAGRSVDGRRKLKRRGGTLHRSAAIYKERERV